MKRIVAKLIRGPLNGCYVSVSEEQTEIGGLSFPDYPAMKLAPITIDGIDDQGQPIQVESSVYVDKYIKSNMSVREFTEEELAKDFNINNESGVVEFNYVAGD